ncbi:cyclic nucleotide-binding domain-containing protein 2-like isoform X2 [Acanthaster planci]|uniref:Cyclic nucleotide-binding domain-containing protein 2 n=1 Tax=Acanthaster planci TaxID=133434 RepID=A0A8B7XNR2_ACAPL|nr:cyclic nucleotide-binding domain-containing protein 2-like isoform X2 [Acanthaster planci]
MEMRAPPPNNRSRPRSVMTNRGNPAESSAERNRTRSSPSHRKIQSIIGQSPKSTQSIESTVVRHSAQSWKDRSRPKTGWARVQWVHLSSQYGNRLPREELKRLAAERWESWRRHMRNQLKHGSNLDKQESRQTSSSKLSHLSPRARFLRAARQVKMLCAVQISLNRYATEAGKGTFGATLPDLVASLSAAPSVVYVPSTKEKLTFNAGAFKSNYEFTWPKKAKEAVAKRPEERTESDVQLIGGLMRGLHSFRKYSRAHQQLIARVVRLQKYGRRRVVVRKGHLGYAFYFIFAGAACVTLDEDEESAFVKKEVTILRKGACFGEIALMKDTRRKATIVCLQDTEFLVVDRDDFFEQGLHQHIQAEFEYKFNFFRRLELFSSWPDDKLEEVSDMARIEEYNHDSVIVKDSRELHWLLFVTKGRCDVLKLVDLAKVSVARNEDDPQGQKKHGGTSLLSGDYPLSLLPEGHRTPFPWLTPHKLPVNTRPKTTGQINCKSKEKIAVEGELNQRRSKSAGVRYTEDVSDLDIPSESYSRSTMTSGLSMHKRRSSDPGTPHKLPSHISLGIATMKGDGVEAGVYIRVDSLRPGQCFGLEGISGEMPQFSLLSLGCELVRVSISKFHEHACEETLDRVKELIPTYPSDHFLWTSFKKQNRWTNFKNDVVHDVMDDAFAQSAPNTFARDLRSTLGRTPEPNHPNQRWRGVSLGSSFASNIMPKISSITNTWVDEKSSPRNGEISRTSYSTSRPVSCQQPRSRPTTTRHDARSERLSAFVTEHCSVRVTTASPQKPQRTRTARATPSPTKTYKMPEIDKLTKPTYTGSLSWRALAKS